MRRLALTVQGRVQGVGFRPHVWRLASAENLSGQVSNAPDGARIEIQGTETNIAQFRKRLAQELPPLAQITAIVEEDMDIIAGENGFKIVPSLVTGAVTTLVSPDIGVCADCLDDIRNSGCAKYGYAFTSCTNCGPRFTITSKMPYDRSSTCMDCFPMCANCAKEYGDPADRRFHAQPDACPACGPGLWFVSRAEQLSGQTVKTGQNAANALEKAGELIQKGGILALKGLGGFQLACDARNPKAVGLLRKRKSRPHKALAVMVSSLDAARKICSISPEAAALLQGPKRPIVLCPSDPASANPLAASIAPDSIDIGLMLPATPLHALLLDWLAGNGLENPALVMTSANPQGEPICLGNREALARLDKYADGWLLHDRDILSRVDDSVVRGGQAPVIIRRARGYVPAPVALALDSQPVLGTGAELKAALCLTRHNQAFLGQHIGDLKSPATADFYQEALRHLQNLLDVEPAAIVCDLHPDFISTQLAKSLAQTHGIPLFQLQHHAAHAASVLAENNIYEPALALCLDGSGLGSDGSIWGGELIYMQLAETQWKRLGSLSPFPLPGGEAAIREPWRIAWVLQKQALEADAPVNPVLPDNPMLAEVLSRGINSPQTSSCGRLFDAVSALTGLCDKITYEGQAALRLEKEALIWLKANTGFTAEGWDFQLKYSQEFSRIDAAAIFAAVMAAWQKKRPIGEIAAAFHIALARAFVNMAAWHAHRLGINKVGLSGGVLQNSLMARLLPRFLAEHNLESVTHKLVPPGDGGIALGQAAWGQAMIK